MKPRLVVRTVQEAEVAGNTSELYMDQQLLNQVAGGDRPPDVPLPEAQLNGLVSNECTIPCVAD